jgi:hypothetical protein
MNKFHLKRLLAMEYDSLLGPGGYDYKAINFSTSEISFLTGSK